MWGHNKNIDMVLKDQEECSEEWGYIYVCWGPGPITDWGPLKYTYKIIVTWVVLGTLLA